MTEKSNNGGKYKGVSWQFVNYICSFGMNFLIQIVLARLIEPIEFGTLAILNTIIAIADIFVSAGVSTALIQKKHLLPEDIFTTQVISGLISVICCLLLVFFAPVIAAYYGTVTIVGPLRILSISLIFNSINAVFSALLMRRMDYKKLFFRTVCVLPIAGAIGVFLAYKEAGLWALVVYQLVLVCLNSLVYITFCEEKIKFRFSLESAQTIYSFGIKVLLTGIINSAYDTVRTLVIGGVYSKGDLAYYDRASTYSKYTVQIAHSMIQSVALPLFSRKQDSIEELRASSRKIVGFSAFVMFPLLFGVAAVSKPLIRLLLTDKWIFTVPYLIIFCFLRIPGVVSIIDNQMFYAIGRSDIILKYSVLSLIINIGLLYFVLPYGVLAIAVNALLVEIIISVVIAIASQKLLQYRVMDKVIDTIKPFVSGMIMFLVVYSFDCLFDFILIAKLVLEVFIGATVYLLLELLLKDTNLSVALNFLINKRRK